MNDDYDGFEIKTRRLQALGEVTDALSGLTQVTEIESSDALPLHGVKILLVDDEEPLVRSMGRFLSSRGAEFWSATSLKTAFEQFHADRYDVVLLDLHLPDGKGTEFLSEIRSNDSSTPVILLSGEPTVDHAMKAIEHRVFRFLTKPVKNEELERLIIEAVADSVVERMRRELNPTKDSLGTQFQRALDSLWLAKQPIVNVDRNTIGFELLTRCEESALMQPQAFWAAASTLDRIPEVGRALRHLAAEALARHPHHTLFINLHVRELDDPALLADDNPILADASRVVFELNTRSKIDDPDHLHRNVDALRQAGFVFAIDDVGHSGSELATFLQIFPEYVKLDHTLVDGIHANLEKETHVRNVVNACLELDIQVIAECVEEAEDFDKLREMNVRLFQGFLFGTPQR